MTLMVNNRYSQPTFCSSSRAFEALSPARKFVVAQTTHLFLKGTGLGVLHSIQPCSSLSELAYRSVLFDGGEALAALIKKRTLTCKESGTNVFAYMADGIRSVRRHFSSK